MHDTHQVVNQIIMIYVNVNVSYTGWNGKLDLADE